MEEDFKKKYTESGKIGQLLIANFYNSLKKISLNINPEKIIEVGCGHGFSTKKLLEIFSNASIEASDHEQYLVEDAQRNLPNIEIKKESIYKLERKDKSFDLVLSLEVLEHLENPEKAIKELSRITRKHCIVSVPNEPLWRILNMVRGKYLKDLGNTPGHINHWSKKSFINFLKRDFEILNVLNPTPWTIVLLKRRND